MKSSTGQIKLPSTLDMGTTVPIAITGWEQSGMQHNINLSVPRQGDRNELLAKVAKRAERAQLLVAIMLTKSHDNLMAGVSLHWVKLTTGRIILIPD